MHRAVPKEGTTSGSEGKFSCIVGPKVGPAGTTKGSKRGIVRSFMEETVNRGVIVDNFAR